MPTNSHPMTTRSTMTIPEAAEMLGITGRESLNGLHARFRELVKEWHPDVSQHDP
jgi:DnaJ-class molecular chaperone